MYNLLSRRIKEQNQETPDVYIYDTFPQEFRNQVFFILDDILDYFDSSESMFGWLRNTFIREKGWKFLYQTANTWKAETEEFFERANSEDFLDYVDMAFNLVVNSIQTDPPIDLLVRFEGNCNDVINEFISELNQRFKQHNLGYEFVDGEIIRIDNKLLHQQTVKPALKLLQDKQFLGADNEIRKAYEFRRNGDNSNVIIEANKAFESTMKSICDGLGYKYNPTKDTAKDLIKILGDNQFYPNYFNSHVAAVRATLESGLPTVRNKNAGHGQGATIVPIPDEYVEYALNLAATNIVFLVKIYESKEKKN